MNVLIAYGSKMGGTVGLAEMLGEDLEADGIGVSVHPAGSVGDIDGYDAVIVGGALYATRWHKDARRFVKRHADALRQKDVWLFSSGPLDDSALAGEIPPVRFVKKTLASIDARGHITFGGRMPADAKGFPARTMAKDNAGDWRDRDQVSHWAKKISEDLSSS